MFLLTIRAKGMSLSEESEMSLLLTVKSGSLTESSEIKSNVCSSLPDVEGPAVVQQ